MRFQVSIRFQLPEGQVDSEINGQFFKTYYLVDWEALSTAALQSIIQNKNDCQNSELISG